MEAQAINEWTLNLAFGSILVIFLFLIMLYYRIRINRLCGLNIFCEFKTDEGTGYTKFMPVQEGKLIIEPTKRRMGAIYPVGDVVTYLVDYPSLSGLFKIFSFVQSKAKKAVFDESTAEPLTNRSPLCLITPQRLFNLDRERFTALATRQSVQEEKRMEQERPKSHSKISWTTILILLVIAALIIIGVIVFPQLGTMKAALGVP